ncbi:hypothetical protein [Stenotrophomonas sp. ZAC14A_NAIMI4_1]|uniref:hypothetical protein n=1 Tax=Stenotrophomonas sp. ZAC14A_NAIMI4_1 TaxID=2072412 RepID=UPI000D540DA0|nr:hypothetical protein [Stenotrophomonas sp. ZAC14A_NAIMI4_1]AWH44516.1 hypothetical protein C1926_05515 [Stenotrophomonas sp. ZAC14A_NAIMI4_1]
MTKKHISHPEGLPNCAAGHRARHIHDLRGPAADGGHLVECACSATSKSQDPERALAEWRRINRVARSARPPPAPEVTGNVVQFNLSPVDQSTQRQRAGGNYGRC